MAWQEDKAAGQARDGPGDVGDTCNVTEFDFLQHFCLRNRSLQDQERLTTDSIQLKVLNINTPCSRARVTSVPEKCANPIPAEFFAISQLLLCITKRLQKYVMFTET